VLNLRLSTWVKQLQQAAGVESTGCTGRRNMGREWPGRDSELKGQGVCGRLGGGPTGNCGGWWGRC
jgi:hypothetical protein